MSAKIDINPTILELMVHVVTARLKNNSVPLGDIPTLIVSIHGSLAAIEQPTASAQFEDERNPAVAIRRSVAPDFIICLEDGLKFKSLKRHLRTKFNMTPEDYRARWGLPNDYLMVAPNYAEARSNLAKKMGLGQQRKKQVPPATRTRGRPAKKLAA